MTEPLKKPPRKDPQKRTVSPTLPPASRSRKALGFLVAAAEGRFALQQCDDCQTVCHPPREACPKCLSMDLVWRDMPTGGELIAETMIRTSTNTYFRERTPWRTGTVKLDAGVTVMAHIHGDVKQGARVRMIARTDKSGKGVMMALPEQETDKMADDRQLRELTCDPKHRRVLVTDCRTASGQALAKALSEAGASIVFAGISEAWRPYQGAASLTAVPNVEIVPLDLTDTTSVKELAGEIGGKVDILVNNAEYVRPGGALDRDDVVTARDEMEVNYFGPLRLMQAFGAAMRSRGADGVNSACAWVQISSVYALANWPVFGCTSASQAAAVSLGQSLRGELAGSGVKVVNVFSGPLEEDWRQPLPPPKVTPQVLARNIVGGLQQGLEEIVVGDVAKDFMRRFREDPRVVERELTGIEGI
ncbi:MAG: SDR family NAD(P)-dependent oxidoreductase [Rhizobiaceae bacterium]